MKFEIKRFWRSLSLSQQVFIFVSVLLVFVTLATAGISGGLFFQWWGEMYRQQFETSTWLASDLISSDIIQFRQLTIYALDIFQRKDYPPLVRRYLESLMTNFSQIRSIVFLDKQKNRKFSLQTPEWADVKIERLGSFAPLSWSNEMYVVLNHPGDRRLYLLFIYEKEQTKAFVIFSLDTILAHFQQRLGRYRTSMGVVDEFGNYVLHTNFEKVTGSEGIGHLPGFREFVRSSNNKTIIDDVSNPLVSYVLVKVEGLPWMVAVEQPRLFWWYIFSKHLVQIFLIFFVVFMFSLVVAYGFSRVLAKVFRMFVDFSRAILTQMPYEKRFASSFPEMEVFVSALEQMASVLQKQQEDLRYSRQIIQDVVNSLSEGLMLVRPEGTAIYLNPEAAHVLGVSPKTDFDTVVRGVISGGFALPLPLLMAIKPYEKCYEVKNEVMLYTAAGSKQWLYVQSKDWHDPQGTFLGKMVMLSDVTTRKQAEQKLLASEKRLLAALETANAMFWDWTISSDELVLSQDWEAKTGISLVHSLAEWLKVFQEEEARRIREALFAYCDGGAQSFVLEHRLPGKEEIWVLNKAHIVERDIFQRPLRVIGVMVDITTIKKQQKQIEDSLAEKEVLLKEVHHRVKNNLQIISSLLSLQGEQTADKFLHRIILDSQVRIRSMALVHEKLYQTKSFSLVSFRDYIFDLVEAIRGVYGMQIPLHLDIQAEEIMLPIETCIPLGLWLSEALTNAFKYAFQDQSEPSLTVIFKRLEEKLLLEVADNGPGMVLEPTASTSSLGLKLLHILAQQLRGEVRFVNERGLRVILEFLHV